jgi:GTP-binding protein
LLLYLVDISEWTTDDPVEAFLTLRRELETYDRTLKKRPFAIAATKLDIQGDGRRLDNLRAFCKKRRIRLFPISAATREGLHEVIRFLGKQVLALRQIRCASNY